MDRRTESAHAAVTPRAAALDASIDAANEGAVDAAMAWISLYIPTWGTSVAMHVAVILLAALMITSTITIPDGEFVVHATPAPPKTPRVARRPTTDPPQTRGKMKLQEASFVKLLTDRPAPGTGVDKSLKDAPIIGINGNPPGGGPPGGLGPTTRGGPFPDAVEIGARKIVYVVDRSGSMTDSIDIVKNELRRSLLDLPGDGEFHVIFFSSGPPAEMPTRRLVAATERNRLLAFEFIDSVVAAQGTDPTQALERAFAARPEVIYLLTDGEFDREIVSLIRRLNAAGNVRVYTIGFLYNPDNRVLRDIAAQNGGEYKFISQGDLDAILRGG